MKSTKRLRLVGVVAALVGSFCLIFWAVTVYRAAHDLSRQMKAVEAVVAAGPSSANPEAITVILEATRRDFLTLDRNVGWLAPLGPLFGWIPGVGPIATYTPSLLDLADALTDVALRLWYDVEPCVGLYQQGASPQVLLPQVATAVSRDVQTKQQLVGRALAAYGDIPHGAVPSRFSSQFATLGQALPLLADGLDFATVAPPLLGMDEPRTYLLLALNEDELRPGGGFISGVGQVQVQAGDLVSMEFRDSYAVDDFSLPYPDPPDALRQFLGADLWVFRDSNWSPDFPTAAQLALELYRPTDLAVQSELSGIDGVIAIDQRGVQMLLDGLGPLWVAGVSEPVTGDTVLDYMHAAWAPDDGSLDREWWAQRKSFMGDLASAAMVQLRSGQVDISALGQSAYAALVERHIQVYFNDAAASALLAKMGWDGSLAVPAGDFLAVVEANVGYNKVSRNIARSVDYQVDLGTEPPRAQVVVQLTHLSDRDQECKPEIRYDLVYEDMMQRCYWAYLRVLVPRGSVLTDASRSPIPANLVYSGEAWPGLAVSGEELGATSFAQAVLIPTSGEKRLSFSYVLPAAVVAINADGSKTYRLLVRKQAGTDEVSGRVVLHLPENVVLLEKPLGLILDGDGAFVYGFHSDVDFEFVVRYSIPEA